MADDMIAPKQVVACHMHDACESYALTGQTIRQGLVLAACMRGCGSIQCVMRAYKMQVNISHAWFIHYRVYGNAVVEMGLGWTNYGPCEDNPPFI